MSLPDPILNFRVKPEIKDAFQVLAERIGQLPGTLGRQWLVERIAHETALDSLKKFGLTEVLRRLSQPSPMCAMVNSTGEGAEVGVQTDANLVTPGNTR